MKAGRRGQGSGSRGKEVKTCFSNGAVTSYGILGIICLAQPSQDVSQNITSVIYLAEAKKKNLARKVTERLLLSSSFSNTLGS